MDSSKSPRKTAWFSPDDTTEKTDRRSPVSWVRLRRRCAIAQVAREASEKKKADGKNEATINQGNSGAADTYIYSQNFCRQERVRTSGLGLPDGGIVNRGIKEQQSTRLLARIGQSDDLFGVDCIIARLATDSQKLRAIAVHHPSSKQRKKAPFLQLISFTYLSKISGILVINQEAIYSRHPNNFSRILGEPIRGICGIFSQPIPNLSLTYRGFETWARAP